MRECQIYKNTKCMIYATGKCKDCLISICRNCSETSDVCDGCYFLKKIDGTDLYYKSRICEECKCFFDLPVESNCTLCPQCCLNFGSSSFTLPSSPPYKKWKFICKKCHDNLVQNEDEICSTCEAYYGNLPTISLPPPLSDE
jgi:hypothetical protein